MSRTPIRADPNAIRTVYPFIKEGPSDVEALRMLFNGGANIRGIGNLNAKLYLYETSRAIITSANLTEAALT